MGVKAINHKRVKCLETPHHFHANWQALLLAKKLLVYPSEGKRVFGLEVGLQSGTYRYVTKIR